MAEPSPLLFGNLHPDAFRIFGGQNRAFYEGLLEHLAGDVFSDGMMIARPVVMEAVRQYLQAVAYDPDQEDIAAVQDPARAREEGPAYAAYARLHATGWLVEHKEGYKRLVDLDSAARLLLDFLLDIKSGRLRSYGGEVLQVESLLLTARGDPQDRSEALSGAARSSKGFLSHLRSVGSAMRKAEAAILEQRTFGEFFQTVFDDFVAKHLIEDFSRLRTKQNPFRFRMRILAMAEEMEGDDLLLGLLGDAYHREGRARDREHGIEVVRAELGTVTAVFRDIDTYLDIIEAASSRVERRLGNAVRYMERIADTDTGRLSTVFRMLASAPVGPGESVAVPSRTLTGQLPLGRENLYQPMARRVAQGPQMMDRQPPDPAFVAFRQAQLAYQDRTMVTPRRMADYLARVMAGRASARASELPCDSLDDFFVFERLRALEHVDDGALAGEWRVTPADGRVDNGWLDCPDFIISRKEDRADGQA